MIEGVPLSEFASAASAFATILLAILTAGYVILTKRLVDETRKSRQDEINRARERREQEKLKLRRAINKEIRSGIMVLQELGQVADFNRLSDEIDIPDSIERDTLDTNSGNLTLIDQPLYSLIPRTVYENNSGDLGLLSDVEVELIVEYYSLADVLTALYEPDMQHMTVNREKARERINSNFSDLSFFDDDLVDQMMDGLPFDENSEISYYSLSVHMLQTSGSWASGAIKEMIEQQSGD